MFKNRKIEMRIVKDTEANTTTENPTRGLSADDISKLTDEVGKKLLIGIITVMTTAFVLGTAEHIIVNATKKN